MDLTTTKSSLMRKNKTLATKIVNKMTRINKKRKGFLILLSNTILSFRWKHIFLNRARYGKSSEKTFRLNYEKVFDSLAFNLVLLAQNHIKIKVIALAIRNRTPNVPI